VVRELEVIAGLAADDTTVDHTHATGSLEGGREDLEALKEIQELLVQLSAHRRVPNPNGASGARKLEAPVAPEQPRKDLAAQSAGIAEED
jgi:hypothetical protein